LQDEQPVVAQLLERGVGLGVSEEFLPQDRAGNQFHDAPAFQQVKHHDYGQRGREQKRAWRQEPHEKASVRASNPVLKLKNRGSWYNCREEPKTAKEEFVSQAGECDAPRKHWISDADVGQLQPGPWTNSNCI
jgi:hypothetical protein